MINITTAAQLDAVRYDPDGSGTANDQDDNAAYEKAFGLEAGASACPEGVSCTGYELMGNLTLSGEWTPIANYSGVFDGNGNTISGLTINSVLDGNFGLFASLVSGAEVSNLGVVGVNITVAPTTGAGVWVAAWQEESSEPQP